jgi:hypothetical protein
MRLTRLLVFLCAVVLAPSAALAVAGSPVQLGTANGTTTAVITTSADAPVGSLIVVASVATNAIAVSSVADNVSNCSSAYTALDNATVASRPTIAVFYCPNTANDLAIGKTITVTVPSTDKVAATAFALGGMATSPADTHAHSSNGASGTSATNVSTGTQGQAYELIVGALALGSTSSAFTPGGQFSSIGGLSSSNGSAWAAWTISCSTVGQSFAPSWTTSNAYMADIVSFKVASANGPCVSKTNAYEILNYGVANAGAVSKTNAYAVMNYGVANSGAVSKTNAYAILQYGPNVSKTNAYIVLQSTFVPKMPFHSFP